MADSHYQNPDIAHLARVMQKGFDTLADIGRETNERIDQTNERLDQTNERLGRLEGRFDNLIATAGGARRDLREDVEDLRSRVERLERKAS